MIFINDIILGFIFTNGLVGTIVDKAAWQCGTELQMMSERLSHRTNTFLPQESVTTALETLYYWFLASHATYLIVVLRRALVKKNRLIWYH